MAAKLCVVQFDVTKKKYVAKKKWANHGRSGDNAEVAVTRVRVLRLWSKNLHFEPCFFFFHTETTVQGQRHGCVRCRYVVQRWTRVAEGGDAALLDRSADRGLGTGATRVPAGVRDQSVGAGQRPSRLPGQAGEMGRWERQVLPSCVQLLFSLLWHKHKFKAKLM